MRARAALVAALIALATACGPRWYYEERPPPVPEMPRSRPRSERAVAPDPAAAMEMARGTWPGCPVAFGRWVDHETAEIVVCDVPVTYSWASGTPAVTQAMAIGPERWQRGTPSTPPATSTYTPPTYTGSGSSGGDVHVRGCYRRDGTYVRPHTRHRPR